MPSEKEALAGRRVFIVEDEWMVSELLQDSLREVGCKVVGTASRLQEAAEKLRSVTFDVAILDVNVNGRMIFPLAEELAARGVPFILSTGYGEASLPDAMKTHPVLQKPFQRPELERALRAALK